MTYRELKAALAELTEEQLDMTVLISYQDEQSGLTLRKEQKSCDGVDED